MKKRLNWQTKGLIVSAMCVIILRIIITVTIIPSYEVMSTNDKTAALKRLESSQHNTRILLVLWAISIIVGVVFAILEYQRHTKNK